MDAQYLTFTMGGEEYGVDILKVQEIKGFTAVTPIPNTPAYVKGVMNLRGAIVPVVDLRARFLGTAAACTAFTVVVLLRVGARTVGLIVDTVSDVLTIASGAIQPTPDFGPSVDARFITGLARAGDKLIVLLDIERVVGADAEPAMAAAS